MARKNKQKKLPKQRNHIARSLIENPRRNAGPHHTREEDYHTGRSKHRKHKRPQNDPGAFDLG